MSAACISTNVNDLRKHRESHVNSGGAQRHMHTMGQGSQSIESLQSLRDVRSLPSPLTRSSDQQNYGLSTGDVAGSLSRAAGASGGSVHDDSFLQPHGLAVLGVDGMQGSPFIEQNSPLGVSVPLASSFMSYESASTSPGYTPEHTADLSAACAPPRHEPSALSAVLQSVASSQAEEIRRQGSCISWAQRDPSNSQCGPNEHTPDHAADPPPTEASPRAPLAIDNLPDIPQDFQLLRAHYRASADPVRSGRGQHTAWINCSCHAASASSHTAAATNSAPRSAAPWTPLSAAHAGAGAASRSASQHTTAVCVRQWHPDQQALLLRLCGANAAHYSVMFLPPGLQAALAALAHLLGCQKWLPCAAMETCPEEQGSVGARVGSLFRSNSVRLRRLSICSVRPVVFYGIQDHDLQGEFWSDIDCECVVIPNDADGHPDLRILDAQLQRHSAARVLLGTFSAACAITGTTHDIHALARVLHRRGALAVFDFSSAGASVASCHVQFAPAQADFLTPSAAAGDLAPRPSAPPKLDGVIVAAGALTGDREAAGALVYRTELFQDTEGTPISSTAPRGPFRTLSTTFAPIADAPARPKKSVVARAARILQRHLHADIRIIAPLSHAYAMHALSVWSLCPAIVLYTSLATHTPPLSSGASSSAQCHRTGTLCFNIITRSTPARSPPPSHRHSPTTSAGVVDSAIRSLLPCSSSGSGDSGKKQWPSNPYARVERDMAKGKSTRDVSRGGTSSPRLLHHNFVAAVLADLYGIQVHAADAPTGPFGQSLVEKLAKSIGEDATAALAAALQDPGICEDAKPYTMGWCQVHFSHLLCRSEVDYVTKAVVEVATHGWKLLPQYHLDESTGVYTQSSSSSTADSTGHAAFPHDTKEAAGAAHKATPSWPQSLNLCSEPSTIPQPRNSETASFSKRAGQAGMQTGSGDPSAARADAMQQSAPPTSVTPPQCAPAAGGASATPLNELPPLTKIVSGDHSDVDAAGGGASLLPLSVVPSVLTVCSTVDGGGQGEGTRRLGKVTARGSALARDAAPRSGRGWFSCFCPQQRSRSLDDAAHEGMSDDLLGSDSSAERLDKCAAVRLPTVTDGVAACATSPPADARGMQPSESDELDTFREQLDESSSSSEDGESDDEEALAPALQSEEVLRAELRAAVSVAQGLYGGASTASAAIAAGEVARRQPRDVPTSSGSIDLTGVLGDESPKSPRLLASFGFRNRRARSRAQLVGIGAPTSEDSLWPILQRQGTSRTITQTSLRGNALDSMGSSVLNAGIKPWALRSVGNLDLVGVRGGQGGAPVAEECKRAFLHPKQAMAALEGGEDLGWLAFDAPEDAALAANASKARSLLLQWHQGHWLAPECRVPAPLRSHQPQRGPCATRPPPSAPSISSVPPLNLPGWHAEPAPRCEEPQHVPRLPLSALRAHSALSSDAAAVSSAAPAAPDDPPPVPLSPVDPRFSPSTSQPALPRPCAGIPSSTPRHFGSRPVLPESSRARVLPARPTVRRMLAP